MWFWLIAIKLLPLLNTQNERSVLSTMCLPGICCTARSGPRLAGKWSPGILPSVSRDLSRPWGTSLVPENMAGPLASASSCRHVATHEYDGPPKQGHDICRHNCCSKWDSILKYNRILCLPSRPPSTRRASHYVGIWKRKSIGFYRFNLSCLP